jgi:hypothetical protein
MGPPGALNGVGVGSIIEINGAALLNAVSDGLAGLPGENKYPYANKSATTP